MIPFRWRMVMTRIMMTGLMMTRMMMARLMMTKMVKLNPFQFNIVGGYEKGFGIFISKVEPGSKVKDFI